MDQKLFTSIRRLSRNVTVGTPEILDAAQAVIDSVHESCEDNGAEDGLEVSQIVAVLGVLLGIGVLDPYAHALLFSKVTGISLSDLEPAFESGVR